MRHAMRWFCAIGLTTLATLGLAQDAGVFGARLDWVPISGA